MKHPKTKQNLAPVKKRTKAAEPAKTNGAAKPHGQQTLDAPGMSASVWPEVNEAAQKLALAQEAAKSAGKARKAAHDLLVMRMKARGQPRYSDRSLGVVVEISAIDRAKLKKLDDGSRRKGRRRGTAYP